MSEKKSPEVAIIAFGGCGNNMIQYFQTMNSSGMQFVLVDADEDSLAQSQATIKLNYTDCRDENKLETLFSDLHLFFLVGGLGGTACEHMPELARKLRKKGCLGIGLLTSPFKFENRKEKADKDLDNIKKEIEKICIFSNDVNNKNGNDNLDSSSLAKHMRNQAEGMWLCIDAMTNKRAKPDKYDLADLDRLIYNIDQ